MENNIFDGAKFGDKFKTRDGRMAIFFCIHTDYRRYDLSHPYACIIDGFDFPLHFYPNGQLYLGNNFKVDEDIICRWDEPIDEDHLRSILPSRNEIQDYLDDNGYLDDDGNFIDYVERAVQIGFEMGYRAVKQE